MVRKLFSSCGTSKNLTLEEQYPHICHYLALFPELCAIKNAKSNENNGGATQSFSSDFEGPTTADEQIPEVKKVDVLQMLLSTSNETLRQNGFK